MLQNYTVTGSVWNEIGSVSLNYFQVVEPILDEYVNVTAPAGALAIPSTVNITLTNQDQDLDFPIWMIGGVDFGDGSNETLYIPLNAEFIINHGYSYGNYTIVVELNNTVSSTLTIMELAIQNEIHALSFGAVSEVLWPDSTVDLDIATVEFNVTSEQPELLENVHCLWNYDNNFTEYMYVHSLNENDSLIHLYEFDESSIGTRNVTVNCSNLVSHVLLNHTVEVVKDEVILDDFISADPVWRTNVSSLTLTLERFATHSCFKFDMDDGNTLLYGRPWCASQEPALTLIPLEYTLELQVNYTYDTFNSYTVSVYAFNHISNQTLLTTTVVKEWYCYTPNITFSDNLTDVNNPLQFYKSLEFSIVPLEVDVDCMKSYNQSTDHWEVRQLGTDMVNATADDVRFFYHPVRMSELPYGQYEADLSVAMTGFENITTVATVYFEITATPLMVSVNSK